MADKKISELPSLTSAEASSDDLLVIVDTSSNETKKITLGDVNTSIESTVDINGGTIDGTVIGGTTPAAGTFSEVNLGDNARAKFGASDDLQIYHDSSDGKSYIRETGSGNFEIRASNLRLKDAVGGNYLTADADGAVQVFHDGSSKLATTSTGVDVTGTVTADRLGIGTSSPVYTLSVNGVAAVGGTNPYIALNDNVNSGSTPSYIQRNSTSGLLSIFNNGTGTNGEINFFSGAGSEAMRINSSGNVGIGTSSPDSTLHLKSSGSTYSRVQSSANNYVLIGALSSGRNAIYSRDASNNAEDLEFIIGGSEAMRIAANGDLHLYESTGTTPKFFWDASAESLGLGTTSPKARIDSSSVSNFSITFNDFSGDGLHIQCDGPGGEGNYAGGISFSRISSDNDSRAAGISAVQTGSDADNVGLAFFTHPSSTTSNNLVEAMRIDSSGNVGIGTSSPAGTLQLQDDTTRLQLTNNSNTGSAEMAFRTTTGSNRGFVSYNFDNDYMNFRTGGSGEAMRIDSSGNLLVGTTDDVVWDNSANSSADNGHNLRAEGRAGFSFYSATAGANATVNINRTGSDGDLIRVFRSGSTVGSIGAQAGDLVIGTGNDYLRFTNARSVVPDNGDGTAPDGLIDFGNSGRRFKDLYLLGGVKLGGSSSFGQIRKVSNTLEIDSYGTSGAAQPIVFKQSINEPMRIDSSGNLLVGTTSNNDGVAGIKLRASGEIVSERNGLALKLNRISTDGEIARFQKDGSTVGSIGSHAGNYLRIGSDYLNDTHVLFGANLIQPANADGSANDGNVILGASGRRFKDLYLSGGVKGNNLTLSGNGSTEHARIDSSGNLLVGRTSNPWGARGLLESTGQALQLNTTGTSQNALGIDIGSNNTSQTAISVYSASANRLNLRIYSNGNVVNHNNSYGALSDLKLKENICDSSSQWDDIKAVKVKKYSMKSDGRSEANMLGVIAQDLENDGMGGLVYETQDRDRHGNLLETSTKHVNYSILYMKSVKALQEAMERIETLESRLTALEN